MATDNSTDEERTTSEVSSGEGGNKVLMVAFHYPPYQGSSGMLRTLNFTRYLPRSGWTPLVLTASPGVYGAQPSLGGASSTPGGVLVWRARALDTARHLSIGRRYLRWMALPDRWVSWYLPAVSCALWLIARYRPRAIWSTYPIASAHLVGLTLQRLTGLPWIADFRDSMTEDAYPTDPLERRTYRWIERRTLTRACRIVFTTEGTNRMYRERYGEATAARFSVVSNGYADEDFVRAEQLAKPPPTGSRGRRPLRLVHSGVLYPSERDPRPFLAAVAALRARSRISAEDVQIVFRATGHDAVTQALIDAARVGDVVKLAEPVGYQSALAEMLEADALLLFQAANCNHQVPAKLYEYMRSGRPIFALTDARGDTAAQLRTAGIDTIADLASVSDISERLESFLDALRAGSAPTVERVFASRFSREAQSAELARLLHTACIEHGPR